MRGITAVLFTITALSLVLQGCGATDSRELPKPPEFPGVLDAMMNDEHMKMPIDTAWIHPQRGIGFSVRLFESENWPYFSQISIRPALWQVPLDTVLLLNEKDRLDQFEWVSSHSFVSEVDHDVIMAMYRLQSGDSTNYIRFTHLEEGSGERYRAVIEGEFQATYYYQERSNLGQMPHIDEAIANFRRLPDTVRITNGKFKTVLLDMADMDYWQSR